MKETLKIEQLPVDLLDIVRIVGILVTNALEAIEGVEKAKVSLKKNEALVKFSAPADMDKMAVAVAEAGYKVI